MQQRFGLGSQRAKTQTRHVFARPCQFQFLVPHHLDPIPQAERRQEVVLAPDLDLCPSLPCCCLDGGDIHVSGDVGCPRLVERMRSEMMSPIGAQRSVLSSRCEILGGVSVVDQEQRTGVEAGDRRPDPLRRFELHLDPAPDLHRSCEPIEP